jgi:hypothetical protein
MNIRNWVIASLMIGVVAASGCAITSPLAVNIDAKTFQPLRQYSTFIIFPGEGVDINDPQLKQYSQYLANALQEAGFRWRHDQQPWRMDADLESIDVDLGIGLVYWIGYPEEKRNSRVVPVYG